MTKVVVKPDTHHGLEGLRLVLQIVLIFFGVVFQRVVWNDGVHGLDLVRVAFLHVEIIATVIF